MNNKKQNRRASRRIRQIVRYAKDVFALWQLARVFNDDRTDPEIPPWHIFVALVFGFLLQMNSLNQLQRLVKRERVKFLVKARKGFEAIASRSTIHRSLKGYHLNRVRDLLVTMVKTAKRTKMFEEGGVGAMLYAALDGTEILKSEEQIAEATGTRNKKVKRGGEEVKVNEWYVRAVMAQLVGVAVPMILGFDRQKARDGDKPSEGELTAAKRLMQWLYATYGPRFLDGIVADALYGCAPILKWFDDKRWFVVCRLDPDKMKKLYEDARDLFQMGDRGGEPDDEGQYEWGGVHFTYRMWDEEGFYWNDVKSPLRVLKFEETKRYSDGRIEQQEIWFVVKGLSKRKISGLKVRFIFHHRWSEENQGFKELKHKWHLKHGFIYHGHAVEALWLIASIVHNVFRAFVVRRLRRPIGRGLATLKEVLEDLWWSVAELRGPLWDLIGFDTS